MSAPLVVFAIGNPSRGDDAIGPELRGRLEKWLDNQNLGDQVELIEDFQLQIEHALDLEGRELALFIDAGANTPAPFFFARIFPSAAVAHTTHAMAPEAVLQVFRQTAGSEPPPAFVLCVRGEKFALGEPMTATAVRHAAVAFDLLRHLCRNPTSTAWDEMVRLAEGFG